jgi:hypothetical protein
MSLSNSPSSGDPLSAAASSRAALRNNVVAAGAFNGKFPSNHRFSLSVARCRVLSLFQPPHKSSSPPLALSRASCIAAHDYLSRWIVVPSASQGTVKHHPSSASSYFIGILEHLLASVITFRFWCKY